MKEFSIKKFLTNLEKAVTSQVAETGLDINVLNYDLERNLRANLETAIRYEMGLESFRYQGLEKSINECDSPAEIKNVLTYYAKRNGGDVESIARSEVFQRIRLDTEKLFGIFMYDSLAKMLGENAKDKIFEALKKKGLCLRGSCELSSYEKGFLGAFHTSKTIASLHQLSKYLSRFGISNPDEAWRSLCDGENPFIGIKVKCYQNGNMTLSGFDDIALEYIAQGLNNCLEKHHN